MPCLRENLLSSRVGIDSEIRLGRHALLVLLACLAAHAGGEVPTWEAKRRASQAAWFEQDDAEEALALLEDAFLLRPPPDAEPEMLKELVQLLEGVNDGATCPSPARLCSQAFHPLLSACCPLIAAWNVVRSFCVFVLLCVHPCIQYGRATGAVGSRKSARGTVCPARLHIAYCHLPSCHACDGKGLDERCPWCVATRFAGVFIYLSFSPLLSDTRTHSHIHCHTRSHARSHTHARHTLFHTRTLIPSVSLMHTYNTHTHTTRIHIQHTYTCRWSRQL